MGNCQAVDAAALVVQHPNGRIERMYWPVSVSEVMKLNPGHYVSLIIPILPIDGEENLGDKTVRFTRVKLLRPSETLVLGRAYRLLTSQEVMKVLRAKRFAKMKKKNKSEVDEKLQINMEKQSSDCQAEAEEGSELQKTSQEMVHQRLQQRPGSTSFAAARSKSWRPALQSISEGLFGNDDF